MRKTTQYFLFDLCDRTFAVPLHAVKRIVRMAYITPLPGAPRVVRGIINLQGRVVPVIDIRVRFGMESRPPRLNDRMIIVGMPDRTVALWADDIRGTIECEESEVARGGGFFSESGPVEGAMVYGDDIVLIQDLPRLLLPEEEEVLDRTIDAGEANSE
jgi:purine-binding chemotaxis protein CheW